MIKKKLHIKIPAVLVRITWSLAAIGVCLMLVSAVQLKKEGVVTQTLVQFNTPVPLEHMLMTNDVHEIVKDEFGSNLVGVPIRHIETSLIEDLVNGNDYVLESIVYIDKLNRLLIDITEREPLLRVFGEDENYYLDTNGEPLEWSANYTARVPVVRTQLDLEDYNDIGKLMEMAKWIRSDEFLRSLIDQIVVKENNEIELIPAIGTHVIYLGVIGNYHRKLSALKAYYNQEIEQQGWKYCKVLDVRYKDQVVCLKNI